MPAREHYTIVAIIALCGSVFVLQQFFDDVIVARFAAVPVEISQASESVRAGKFSGETVQTLATLFTATLLHGDAEHIVFNMVFLWAFGSLASRHLGPWWAVVVFVVTGVVGNVVQVLLNAASPAPILGASGAICGFEGLYLGLALRWDLDWPDVWPLSHPIPPLQLAAFGVAGFLFDAYSLMNHDQGVAYGAHMGGLLAGLSIAAGLTTLYRSEAAFTRASANDRRY